jgi:hypothetical protein
MAEENPKKLRILSISAEIGTGHYTYISQKNYRLIRITRLYHQSVFLTIWYTWNTVTWKQATALPVSAMFSAIYCRFILKHINVMTLFLPTQMFNTYTTEWQKTGKIRDVYYSFIHQWFYSFLLGPGCFFSFVMLYTVGKTLWTGDQPVARPLPTHRTTQTQNKRTQTLVFRVEFEPTIPAFERAKTAYALDYAATVIGLKCLPPDLNDYCNLLWAYLQNNH